MVPTSLLIKPSTIVPSSPLSHFVVLDSRCFASAFSTGHSPPLFFSPLIHTVLLISFPPVRTGSLLSSPLVCTAVLVFSPLRHTLPLNTSLLVCIVSLSSSLLIYTAPLNLSLLLYYSKFASYHVCNETLSRWQPSRDSLET